MTTLKPLQRLGFRPVKDSVVSDMCKWHHQQGSTMRHDTPYVQWHGRWDGDKDRVIRSTLSAELTGEEAQLEAQLHPARIQSGTVQAESFVHFAGLRPQRLPGEYGQAAASVAAAVNLRLQHYHTYGTGLEGKLPHQLEIADHMLSLLHVRHGRLTLLGHLETPSAYEYLIAGLSQFYRSVLFAGQDQGRVAAHLLCANLPSCSAREILGPHRDVVSLFDTAAEAMQAEAAPCCFSPIDLMRVAALATLEHAYDLLIGATNRLWWKDDAGHYHYAYELAKERCSRFESGFLTRHFHGLKSRIEAKSSISSRVMAKECA
jgi:hypothetical protein